MKLVSTFIGPTGEAWKIYHGSNKQFRDRFEHPDTKELCVGMTYFAGKWKNKIFVDNGGTDSEIFDTTVHEILHVIWREMGLNKVVEESIVNETATRLALVLEQL